MTIFMAVPTDRGAIENGGAISEMHSYAIGCPHVEYPRSE
jgi:hypothetical protein